MSLNSVNFGCSVGINELLSSDETTADADENLVALLDSNVDSLLAEVVDALGLSQE